MAVRCANPVPISQWVARAPPGPFEQVGDGVVTARVARESTEQLEKHGSVVPLGRCGVVGYIEWRSRLCPATTVLAWLCGTCTFWGIIPVRYERREGHAGEKSIRHLTFDRHPGKLLVVRRGSTSRIDRKTRDGRCSAPHVFLDFSQPKHPIDSSNQEPNEESRS